MLSKIKKVIVKVKGEVEGEEYWQKRSIRDNRLDWRNGGNNWIQEYVMSHNHPHRQLILDALAQFYPFAGVLEVGCNTGPNLERISGKYPETQLTGVDLSEVAIEQAKELLPKAILQVGNVLSLPFEDKSFDVVIADAVLMYVDSKNIEQALSEIDRVSRRGIVLFDWVDKSRLGVVKNHHWVRDYSSLLHGLGYDVQIESLTKEQWPSPNWIKNGRFIIAVRQ